MDDATPDTRTRSEVQPPTCVSCKGVLSPPCFITCENGHSACGACQSYSYVCCKYPCMAPLLDPPARSRDLDSYCQAITPVTQCDFCETTVELSCFGAYHKQVCVLPHCDDRFCVPDTVSLERQYHTHLNVSHGAIGWHPGDDDDDADTTIAKLRYTPSLRMRGFRKVVQARYPDDVTPVLQERPRDVEMLRPVLVGHRGRDCIVLLPAIHEGHLLMSATLLQDPEQVGNHITQKRLRVEVCDRLRNYDDVSQESVHSLDMPIRTRYQPRRYFHFRDWGTAVDWESVAIKRIVVIR